MFKQFFNFEVRFWLRSWMLWVFFLIVALMFFGAASSDQITVGSSLKNTYRNAPWVVENFYAVCSLLTLLMTTAFVNSAASRDFAHNTHQIVFSTPIRKLDYLAGRFLGSALIAVIPLLGVSVGILAAKYMPWVDAERWGPVVWAAHWKAILVFAVPNTLFIAAVIFAIAVLTRSTVVSFLGSLALARGIRNFPGAHQRPEKPETGGADRSLWHRSFSLRDQILDCGREEHALHRLLRIHAVEPADLAGGRGADLCLRLLALQLCGKKSEEEESQSSGERLDHFSTAIPVADRNFGAGAEWLQFWGTVKIEFRRLVKTTIVHRDHRLRPAELRAGADLQQHRRLRKHVPAGHVPLARSDRGNALPVPDRDDHLLRRRPGVGGARQRHRRSARRASQSGVAHVPGQAHGADEQHRDHSGRGHVRGAAGAVLSRISPLPDRPLHCEPVWHRSARASSFWPFWRFLFMSSRPTSTSATSDTSPSSS